MADGMLIKALHFFSLVHRTTTLTIKHMVIVKNKNNKPPGTYKGCIYMKTGKHEIVTLYVPQF